jgi:hypothetical protein
MCAYRHKKSTKFTALQDEWDQAPGMVHIHHIELAQGRP